MISTETTRSVPLCPTSGTRPLPHSDPRSLHANRRIRPLLQAWYTYVYAAACRRWLGWLWLVGGRHGRVWSRWTALDPVRCDCCGWVGPLRRAIHPLSEAEDELEAPDRCPRCGGDVW